MYRTLNINAGLVMFFNYKSVSLSRVVIYIVFSLLEQKQDSGNVWSIPSRLASRWKPIANWCLGILKHPLFTRIAGVTENQIVFFGFSTPAPKAPISPFTFRRTTIHIPKIQKNPRYALTWYALTWYALTFWGPGQRGGRKRGTHTKLIPTLP